MNAIPDKDMPWGQEFYTSCPYYFFSFAGGARKGGEGGGEEGSISEQRLVIKPRGEGERGESEGLTSNVLHMYLFLRCIPAVIMLSVIFNLEEKTTNNKIFQPRFLSFQDFFPQRIGLQDTNMIGLIYSFFKSLLDVKQEHSSHNKTFISMFPVTSFA